MTHLRGAIEQFAETGYGRGTPGERMISLSFNFALPSEVYGEYNLRAVAGPVPVGFERVFQNLTIAVNEDEFIHSVSLIKESDNIIFFWSSFINHEMFDFPGEALVAGDSVIIGIQNGADEETQFIGAINYVERKI